MKVLFNSIIRTMYSGCYYKKGSRVIYLYDIKQTGDSQTVIFFECEYISRPKEITVLYNEFRPVEKLMISITQSLLNEHNIVRCSGAVDILGRELSVVM